MATDPVTVAPSIRGRAVETRVGLQTSTGVLPTAWTPFRMYTTTGGMMQSLVRDDKIGIPSANPRDLGKRRYGLPGGSLSRDVPLNINEMPVWLGAGLTRTTTGAGPYVHTLVPGDTPTNTLTLLQKFSATDWTYDQDAALSAIRIQAVKGENAAKATLTLIGLKDAAVTAAPSGTVASPYADEDFSDWAWSATWNGALIGDCTSVDCNIDLGVERVQGLSGDQWPTQHHFGDVVSTGSFKLYGLGATFRSLALAQTPGTLVLAGHLPADPTNKFFSMTFNNAQMNRPQRVVGGPGQQSADFSFESSADTVDSAVAFAIGNGIASY